MRKVFVVNDAGHDYSSAESYGELIFMTRGMLPVLQLTRMLREFDEHLKGSSPADYILHSGPSVVNSIACSLFAVKHKKLNLLLFVGDGYELRQLNFENFMEVTEDERRKNAV